MNRCIQLLLVLFLIFQQVSSRTRSQNDSQLQKKPLIQAKKNSDEAPKKQDRKTKEVQCNGKMSVTENSGEIFTPNYPNDYPVNITCVWTIQTPKDHHIYIYFRYFHIEEGVVNAAHGPFGSPECYFDLVYMYEEISTMDHSSQRKSALEVKVERMGATEQSHPSRRNVWGIFCGKEAPPPRMSETAGSKVVLIFHSDKSKTNRGFWASFHSIKTKDLRNLAEGRQPEGTDNDNTYEGSAWEDGYETNPRKAYTAIVLFIFAVILIAAILHFWQGSPFFELLPATCFLHPRRSDSLQSTGINIFRNNNRDNSSQETPTLPSPPPAYGELVKTDDDWRQALERMGETEESIERYRSLPENIEVEYDIMRNETTAPTSNNSANTRPSEAANQSSSSPMSDPRNGVTNNFLPNVADYPVDDVIRVLRHPESSSPTQRQDIDPENIERNARPPFCSPIH